MPEAHARRRHAQLIQEISRHDHAYYVLDRPTISDREYDRLYRELVDLETHHPATVTPDSPTRRVGGQPLARFSPVSHGTPMLSLDNTYSRGEIEDFLHRVQRALGRTDLQWTVEPKIDGVAVNLRYEAGHLTTGATRGDGTTGDDITSNLKTVRSIPLRLRPDPADLPEVLEVRGEVFVTRSGFARLNQARRTAGQEVYANPRNTAAGSLKQLDPKIVACRPLDALWYGVGLAVDPPPAFPTTQIDLIAYLRALGFKTPPRLWLCAAASELLSRIEELDDLRRTFNYETDGAVIKLNSIPLRERLGATTKAPRWAIAYKYEPERARTQLKSIRIQVGRTGSLTPVAELEPVVLSGSTVRRATLHNEDDMRRKDIRVGDTVIIEKAGEIIPAVVEVDRSKRTGKERAFQFPRLCPECQSPVVRDRIEDETGVTWRCPDPDCPAQVRGRIEHWCSRGAMDIEGGGRVLVRQLVERQLVKDIADLYALRLEDLAGLERRGERSARRFLGGLAASRSRPLWRLLFGLGIHHVGASVAKALCRNRVDLTELEGQTPEQLIAVEDVGQVIAESLVTWFADPRNQDLLRRLKAAGLNLRSAPQAPRQGPGVFEGKTLVLTGTLPSLTRQQATARIEAAGGKVRGSLSRKTDYILAGSDPGSKLEKARQLGIPVLDEAAFLRRLAQD